MSKILITITLSTLISCSTSISQPQFSDFGLVTVINHPDHGYYYWTDKNNPSICYIDNNNDGVVDTIINHVGMNKKPNDPSDAIIYQDQNGDGYFDYKKSGSNDKKVRIIGRYTIKN